MEEKKRFPGLILCMCGFLLGSFIPNLIWKTEWHQGTLEAIYYLTSFTASGSVSGVEYLKEIIKFRGSLWSLCMICGFSVFGAPLSVTGLLILGCRIGMVIAVSILEFGLLGGLIGTGLLFPQYLLYIPGWIFLMEQIWEQSIDIWKHRELFPVNKKRYFGRIGISAFLLSGGILAECYLNPWIVEKILDYLK